MTSRAELCTDVFLVGIGHETVAGSWQISEATTCPRARNTDRPADYHYPNPSMTTTNLEVAPRNTKRDKVMSRAEVAAFLGVSVGAVDAYCRQEDDPLPSRKVGRRVLFWRSQVENWFEDHGRNGKSGRGGLREPLPAEGVAKSG